MFFVPTVIELMNDKTNKCPLPVWAHDYQCISWNDIPVCIAPALSDSIINMQETRLHFDTRSCLVNEQAVHSDYTTKESKNLKREQGVLGQRSSFVKYQTSCKMQRGRRFPKVRHKAIIKEVCSHEFTISSSKLNFKSR